MGVDDFRMNKLLIFFFMFSILTSTSVSAEWGNWISLKGAINKNLAIESESHVGERLILEGEVLDSFIINSQPLERPNPLRIEITEKGKKSGIFAVVKLKEGDIESVARFPAAQILIKVDSIIQSIDTKRKIIYVTSLSSSVIASN